MKKLPYEVEIGKAVAEYLTGLGWEVYPEVALYSYHGSCDIVAVKRFAGQTLKAIPPVVLAVECKRGITCQLVRQLWRWRKYADMLAVGVPERWRMELPKYDARADFEGLLLENFYMGMFGVGAAGGSAFVKQELRPPTVPRKSDAFLEVIDQQHKNATPGMVNGKRFTALDATLRNLTDYVKANPGCAFRQAVKNIRHHYAHDRSAQSALLSWLRPPWFSSAGSRAPEVIMEKRQGRWYCEFEDQSGVM